MKSPFTLDWENMKSPFTFDWENIVIVYIGLGKHKVIVYTGLTGIGKHEVIVYIGLGEHEVTVYIGLIGLWKNLHWTDMGTLIFASSTPTASRATEKYKYGTLNITAAKQYLLFLLLTLVVSRSRLREGFGAA